MGMDGDVVRDAVLGALGTLRVDPACMRDERKPEPFAERCQTVRKELRVCLVGVDPEVPLVGFRVPIARLALAIPPAVELHVAERKAHPDEVVANAEEGSFVSLRRLEVVVIRGAVVGPVAEVLEGRVSVVRRAYFSLNIGEDAPPRVERSIDAVIDDQQSRMTVALRQRGDRSVNAALDLATGSEM